MQLSAPLPPFDLSVALPAAPAAALPAGVPSGDAADFNSLLSAHAVVAPAAANAAASPVASSAVAADAEPDILFGDPTFSDEAGDPDGEVADADDASSILVNPTTVASTLLPAAAPTPLELGIGAVVAEVATQDAPPPNGENTLSSDQADVSVDPFAAEKSAGIAEGEGATGRTATSRANRRSVSGRGAAEAVAAAPAEFAASGVVSRAKDAIPSQAAQVPQPAQVAPTDAKPAPSEKRGPASLPAAPEMHSRPTALPLTSAEPSHEDAPIPSALTSTAFAAAPTATPVAPSPLRNASTATVPSTAFVNRSDVAPDGLALASSLSREPNSSSAPGSLPDAKAVNASISPESTSVSGSRIENFDTAIVADEAVQAEGTPHAVSARRGAAEKIAVSSPRAAALQLAAYKVAEKNPEVAVEQSVEGGDELVGTNVAKSEPHMPSAAPHAISAPHAVERLSQAVAPLSFDAAAGDEMGEPAELSQAARRAVDAALAVTEKFAAEGKPSVTLKFTVSGVDLGVRVELRGENVHTTFRTDSPELRAALAQEWQSVAAVHSADRNARLAEPVFTSSATPSSANNSAGSDFGAADQRGSQQRQEQGASDEWARYRSLSRPTDAAPLRSAATVVAPRSTVSSAPGRLHTFA